MFDESRSERAIVIVDMLNEFAHIEGKHYEPSVQDIIPFIQGELTYFRERMRPIIFCNTSLSDPFGSLVIQQLSPRTGEISIKKVRPNAFFKTDLADILFGLKIKKITIVGAFSHTGILMTAASALDHGFDVVVPETCVCTDNMQDHNTSLRLINRWLKLP